MKKIIKYATLASLLVIQGCDDDSKSENQEETAVTGIIDFYGAVNVEDITTISVKLLDVSRADADSITVSEIEINNIDSLPIDYSISYDETLVEDNHSYSISVSAYGLNSSDELTRTHLTTESYPVITQGYDSQEDVYLESIN